MTVSFLQDEVTTAAWCWKLTLADGSTMGFTNHDVDLTISGITYEAASGFTPTAVETSRDMAVDNLDIQGAIDSTRITKDDLLSGKYDGAQILIFQCDWSNLSSTAFKVRKGTLGQVSAGKTAFTAEIRGLMQAYQQDQGDVYQKSCRTTLGSTKCGVNTAAYTSTFTVTAYNSSDGSIYTDSTRADYYYDYGLLTWTSTGPNNGKSVEIKRFTNTNGKFMPFLPFTYTPSTGDTFTAISGCDGNFTTCSTKFSNVVNFRGEPHVPGSDYAASYPAQGSANTVSEGADARR
jgi:uncharacterized phage protein (TIGR02218 family)